jgi:hypothetical protein
MNMTKQAEKARRQRMNATQRIIHCNETQTMEHKQPQSDQYNVRMTVKQARKRPHLHVAHLS